MLTGLGRVVFKGLIRPLAYADGAMSFCRGQGMLYKDYKQWMMGQTAALVEAVDRYAHHECGQGILPLKSWRADKPDRRQACGGRGLEPCSHAHGGASVAAAGRSA